MPCSAWNLLDFLLFKTTLSITRKKAFLFDLFQFFFHVTFWWIRELRFDYLFAIFVLLSNINKCWIYLNFSYYIVIELVLLVKKLRNINHTIAKGTQKMEEMYACHFAIKAHIVSQSEKEKKHKNHNKVYWWRVLTPTCHATSGDYKHKRVPFNGNTSLCYCYFPPIDSMHIYIMWNIFSIFFNTKFHNDISFARTSILFFYSSNALSTFNEDVSFISKRI